MKPLCKLCNAEMEPSEDCGGDCYNCISEIEADMGGDEQGVCANCGDEMDFSPTHPWCSACDEEGVWT